MVGTQHIDVMRSFGLASRSSRRHVSLPLSWNTLLKHRKRKDFAMLLTLLGAGSMGALIAMRYASGTPVGLSFSWTAADNQKASNDVKNKADLDLTVAGLQNMGNNCFLNVVLQALASSEILVSFVEECASVIDTQGVQAEQATMPLAAAVADLLRELAHGQIARRILSPRRVMCALNLYTQQFDLSMQQDAAEALAHLAAGLQEERDKYLHLRRPVSQSFGTVLDKVSATPQLDQSWIHWPLEGTLGSLMACQRCGFQFSTVFQYFNDISLPLARQGDGNMIDNCTLEDCLDRFTAPEWVASVRCSHCAHMDASQILRTKMDSSELTTSPEQLDVHTIQETIETIQKCSCDDDCSCEAQFLKHGGVWNSVHTNASKRLRIGRSPEVLCLQVQRAVVNEVGELRKLTGHVKFPKILDLFPYTVAAQDIKVRSIDTRTEDLGNPLIKMLGQRRVMLSHIRKLHGSDYPTSLFSLEPGIKGGSELSKQTEDLVRALESSHDSVAAEDVIADVASKEGLMPEDPRTHPGVLNNVASTEIREVDDLSDVRTSKNNMVSTEIREVDDLSDVETSKNNVASTEIREVSDLTDVETSNLVQPSTLEVLTSSNPGCTDLGALADPHGVQNVQPTAERTLTSRKLLYELLSVVVHHGGPQSGHYTVYRKVRLPKETNPEVRTVDEDGAGLICNTEVRERPKETETDETVTSKVPEELQVDSRGRLGKRDSAGGGEYTVWFKVSDTNVRRADELEVQLANASLLFYERLSNA